MKIVTMSSYKVVYFSKPLWTPSGIVIVICIVILIVVSVNVIGIFVFVIVIYLLVIVIVIIVKMVYSSEPLWTPHDPPTSLCLGWRTLRDSLTILESSKFFCLLSICVILIRAGQF